MAFEIAPTDDPSKFKMRAKMVSTTMDSILLDFEVYTDIIGNP